MLTKYKKIENEIETYEVSVSTPTSVGFVKVGKIERTLYGQWTLTAYFDNIFSGNEFLKEMYSDMTEAGNILVEEWKYYTFTTNNDRDTEEIFIGDLFK